MNEIIPRSLTAIPRRESPAALGGSLWGVVVSFNPAAYRSKLTNLRMALASARRQGLKVLVVEGAFETDAFSVVPEDANALVQVKLSSRLWQKERLLNIGIESLPASCDRVVWMDGDILFTDNDWPGKVADLLQLYIVVQPFQTAYWLNSGALPPSSSQGESLELSICRVSPSTAFSEAGIVHLDYPRGHTGFAWAARRDVFAAGGLYDRMVLGGADTIIASAMYGLSAQGLLTSYCTLQHARHISSWMERFHRDIRGSVGYLDGEVYHLWHGSRKNRRYEERHNILIEEQFDPLLDLSCGSGEGLSWASRKPDLHRRVYHYFHERREDDEPSPENV